MIRISTEFEFENYPSNILLALNLNQFNEEQKKQNTQYRSNFSAARTNPKAPDVSEAEDDKHSICLMSIPNCK